MFSQALLLLCTNSPGEPASCIHQPSVLDAWPVCLHKKKLKSVLGQKILTKRNTRAYAARLFSRILDDVGVETVYDMNCLDSELYARNGTRFRAPSLGRIARCYKSKRAWNIDRVLLRNEANC